MLFRQLPPDPLCNYYIIDSEKSQRLQVKGFVPIYFWDGAFYYKKTDELIKFMEGGNG